MVLIKKIALQVLYNYRSSEQSCCCKDLAFRKSYEPSKWADLGTCTRQVALRAHFKVTLLIVHQLYWLVKDTSHAI
jgi:hypothetical protein